MLLFYEHQRKGKISGFSIVVTTRNIAATIKPNNCQTMRTVGHLGEGESVGAGY